MSPEAYIIAGLGVIAVIVGPAGVMRHMVKGALDTLNRIEHKIDCINGKVDNHEARLSVLEDRVKR